MRPLTYQLFIHAKWCANIWKWNTILLIKTITQFPFTECFSSITTWRLYLSLVNKHCSFDFCWLILHSHSSAHTLCAFLVLFWQKFLHKALGVSMGLFNLMSFDLFVSVCKYRIFFLGKGKHWKLTQPN